MPENKDENGGFSLEDIWNSVVNSFDRHIQVHIPETVEKIQTTVHNVSHNISHNLRDATYDADTRIFLFGYLENLLPEDKQKFVQDAYTTLTTNLSPIHESLNARVEEVHNGADLITIESLIEDTKRLRQNDEATNELVDTIVGLLESDYGQYSTGSSDGASLIRSVGSQVIGTLTDVFGGRPGPTDGVTETSFGMLMENSWCISSNSFLNTFKRKETSMKVNILNSTPLDPGEARESLYGSMMLGCPFIYNVNDDPNNRNLTNTILKNSRFLSLTPGFPKYNGTIYSPERFGDNSYNQTQTGEKMLKYLKKNHLDSDFSDKDKRYYSFKTDYAAYFAYLEAMLNPIWIKLGLSKGADDQTFNIFSFFKIKGDSGTWDPTKAGELIEKYQSSIGFYINPSSTVSESVDSSTSDHGVGDDASTRALAFQKIHYITGMDSNSWKKRLAIGNQYVQDFGNFLSETFQSAGSLAQKFGGHNPIQKLLLSPVGFALGAAVDLKRVSMENDLGVVLQSYAISNGMKLQYPRLWIDSSYSKSMNFSLSFVSPYGDPLSIFKYVYVPFCAMLCFALPRQASENGLVSPFLVRADIPGLITSDLAMISNLTWTKGGADNLWTKDGLPRAIDVSFTIEDLYPYLAMSKRMSFLSANPSYTVFLDNMSGLCALKDESQGDDILNNYFDELINRVNSQSSKDLWNVSNQHKREMINSTANKPRRPLTGNLQKESINWLK